MRFTLHQRSDVRLATEITKNIVNKTDGISSVLDIGCGDGAVQAYLSKEIRYKGIDIVNSCIYKQCDHEDVSYVSYDEVEGELAKHKGVDCVLLLDVIEHEYRFTRLAECAAGLEPRVIIISLPNELFFLDRLRFLAGKELPAHSLDLIGQPAGFKHQYIVNPAKAYSILASSLGTLGYYQSRVYYRSLIPKNILLRPITWLLSHVTPSDLWSMGSIHVFSRNEGL